jgi:putative chitinase
MITITPDILKSIAPRAAIKLLNPIADNMTHWFPIFNIDTKEEARHFLAQAAHETDSFNSLTEYASGKAYEGRRDLGNINPGDGVKYKGRGIFQTTGLTNYHHLDTLDAHPVSFELNPELLSQPYYAVWSACVFWNDRHLSDIANMPDYSRIYSKLMKKELTPIEYITLRINGRQNGIVERRSFYERAKKIIV